MIGLAMRAGIYMTRRIRWCAAAAACGAIAVLALPAFSQAPAPSPELRTLERQVSLKIAHVRIKGPTNAADLKQLGLAQRAQFEGEKAIAEGNYKKAEQDFIRANVLISTINQ
jgi:hypothetical protein